MNTLSENVGIGIINYYGLIYNRKIFRQERKHFGKKAIQHLNYIINIKYFYYL